MDGLRAGYLRSCRQGRRAAPTGFREAARATQELLRDLGGEAIVAGHGVGGLIALKIAETPGVRAGVAFAPAVPGFRTPLFAGLRNRIALWTGNTLKPPSGRILFELVADADSFQRPQLIDAMVPASAPIANDIIRGKIQFAASDAFAPRLIVVGGWIFLAARSRRAIRECDRRQACHARGTWSLDYRWTGARAHHRRDAAFSCAIPGRAIVIALRRSLARERSIIRSRDYRGDFCASWRRVNFSRPAAAPYPKSELRVGTPSVT